METWGWVGGCPGLVKFLLLTLKIILILLPFFRLTNFIEIAVYTFIFLYLWYAELNTLGANTVRSLTMTFTSKQRRVLTKETGRGKMFVRFYGYLVNNFVEWIKFRAAIWNHFNESPYAYLNIIITDWRMKIYHTFRIFSLKDNGIEMGKF